MSLDLDYYYGNEAEQYSFYRIPKVLLTDRRYRGVSVEAKVLYGLLLDRMSLSVRNGWLDNEGRVYIYFTHVEYAQCIQRAKLNIEVKFNASILENADFLDDLTPKLLFIFPV